VKGKAQGVPAETVAATHADLPLATEPTERFTQLYERHFAFVWRSARMLGVPADAIDDAVQDVFLVAHRRLADFEERSSPRTWLFAIALRVVSDHRRSRRRRLRLLERAQSVDPVPSATPFDSALGAERRDALLGALERLPEEQRAAFILAEVEEMSAPEISAALDVNVNTVYSRLRMARRAMAGALDWLELAPGSAGSRNEKAP
jgi:RNA polymerase sigma-70 factor (ECF subfamily)